MKRALNWLVELVRLPMSMELGAEVQVIWVVCWLEVTQVQPSWRSLAQDTRSCVLEETGFVRFISREMLFVEEIVWTVGVKVMPLNPPGLLAAKEVLHVIQAGWEVELTQQSKLAVIDMLCVDAGLRALASTSVRLLLLLVEYKFGQLSSSLKKLWAVLGLRMLHCPLQIAAVLADGKLVSVQALHAGNCICKIEPAAIVTEGDKVKVQFVEAPTTAELEVIEQAITALMKLISAELLLQMLEELPGWQQLMVVMKEPEYRAVDVEKDRDMLLTVEFMFSWVNTIELEDDEQVALAMALPLRVALQLAALVMEKAELRKVSERSKLVLKAVIELSEI